jgi:hypothetical protein
MLLSPPLSLSYLLAVILLLYLHLLYPNIHSLPQLPLNHIGGWGWQYLGIKGKRGWYSSRMLSSQLLYMFTKTPGYMNHHELEISLLKH